jgi:hypothetical protein
MQRRDSLVLKAGDLKVNLDVQDQANTLYALTLFTLDEGWDVLDPDDFHGRLAAGWAEMVLFEELGSGKSASYTATIEEGPVYLVCWSKPPDAAIGNAGPFTVEP